MKDFKYFLVIIVTCLFFTSPIFATVDDSTYWLKNTLSFGFYDQNFFSPNLPLPPRPLFWHDPFTVDYASFVSYQRLLYHSQKYFEFYGGTDVAPLIYKNTVNVAIAADLGVHVYFFRYHWVSPYLNYSIAGPTYLTRNVWGQADFSYHFVFQDMIGLGISLLPEVPLDLGFNVIHYSNGGIFPKNSGIQIPFAFWVSYLF